MTQTKDNVRTLTCIYRECENPLETKRKTKRFCSAAHRAAEYRAQKHNPVLMRFLSDYPNQSHIILDTNQQEQLRKLFLQFMVWPEEIDKKARKWIRQGPPAWLMRWTRCFDAYGIVSQLRRILENRARTDAKLPEDTYTPRSGTLGTY